MTMPAYQPLLHFWFDPATQPRWFGGGPAFDAELRERYGVLLARGAAGELDGWAETPHGALALVVLLDQLSRNIYRGTPAAFAQDAAAMAVVMATLPRAFDCALTPLERGMFYTPLMHAEDLPAQTLGCALYAKLGNPEALYYARLHLAVVERFGRFPHRNEWLGRPSTAAETHYLAQGGLRF